MSTPADFIAEVRARTDLATLVRRRVKLTRSGRDWKGLCPFHSERTPSFYVYESAYHCFGCGIHGDAIDFAMSQQGLSFQDAIAQLAQEAGLDVPKPDPREAAAERKRQEIRTVLNAAQGIYARLLRQPEGAEGLAYLRTRGLDDATISRFGLGWSGDGSGGVKRELVGHGFSASLLRDAGLLRSTGSDPGRELLFNRVTFPIHDPKGGLVSFGGRSLGDAKPKYINGPETALFQKRRALFGLHLAHDAVRRGAPLLIVEGYLDAITLQISGFPGAVGSLGTALAREQLQEAWRHAPSPTICFDGDAAGIASAKRAIDAALPILRRTRACASPIYRLATTRTASCARLAEPRR